MLFLLLSLKIHREALQRVGAHEVGGKSFSLASCIRVFRCGSARGVKVRLC